MNLGFIAIILHLKRLETKLKKDANERSKKQDHWCKNNCAK